MTEKEIKKGKKKKVKIETSKTEREQTEKEIKKFSNYDDQKIYFLEKGSLKKTDKTKIYDNDIIYEAEDGLLVVNRDYRKIDGLVQEALDIMGFTSQFTLLKQIHFYLYLILGLIFITVGINYIFLNPIKKALISNENNQNNIIKLINEVKDGQKEIPLNRETLQQFNANIPEAKKDEIKLEKINNTGDKIKSVLNQYLDDKKD